MLERSSRRTFLAEREAAAASARADALLRNVLPPEVADRLIAGPGRIADGIDGVSVVLADVEGFTPLAASLPAERVVALLDELFGRLDDLCDRHSMAKIKTIGDAYMAVAGAPASDPDHAGRAAAFALDVLKVREEVEDWPGGLRMRVGINSGPVVAGVIGRRRLAYDLWGDTVNISSRMESHGRAGVVPGQRRDPRAARRPARVRGPRAHHRQGPRRP